MVSWGDNQDDTRDQPAQPVRHKETLDQSSNEIFLQQIKGISGALARAAHAEAASRKLAIKTAWRCAGRGGGVQLNP